MTFKLQMRLPVSDVESDIRKVGTGLSGLENKSAEVGEAFGRSMKEAGEHAEKAAGILEKIGGSSSLLAGFVGGGIGGLASSAFEGLIETFKGIGEHAEEMRERMREMRDEYILTSNAALKFVDAARNANRIIAEQQDLAHGLHGSLHETLELYDSVRDGTDDLNLSHGEQIRLTKSLGEAVQLAGRSMGEAGGVMGRLSYAMASGSISGLELKSMMRQVPPLADLWTKSLGLTRKELVDLANKGLLDVNRLIDPLLDNVGELDSQFGKQRRTTAQWREELKSAFELARGRGLNSMEAMREALQKTGDASIDMATRQKAAADLGTNALEKASFKQMAFSLQFVETAKTGKSFNEVLEDTTSKLGRISGQFERAQAAAASWDAALSEPKGLRALVDELAAVGTQGFGAFEQLTKFSRERATAVQQAKQDLVALEAAHKSGAIPASQYAEKSKELRDIIAGISPAARSAALEIKKLGQALLGNESMSDRAIRVGKAEREAIDAQKDYVSSLEQAADPMALFQEKLAQLEDAFKSMGLSERAYLTEKNRLYAEAFDSGVLANGSDATAGELEVRKQIERDQKAFHEDITSDTSADLARERLKNLNEEGQKLGQTFAPLKDVFADVFKSGELDADRLLGTLDQIALKVLQMGLLSSLSGPGAGAGKGFLAGLIGGGMNGFDHLVGSGVQLPGFARGGDMIVGGHGGPDTVPAMFMVSPNESIHVRTPAQRAVAAAAQAPVASPLSVTIVAQNNERDVVAAGNTYAARRVAVKNQRQFGTRTR